MKIVNRSLFVGLLGAGFVASSPIQVCPSNAGGVCYRIAVPTSSANAGSGNIYFQIHAPTSFQWVALGTGQSMSGSNIFLMYQDGRGNLTLSPRQAAGHTMPVLDSSSNAARLTLLEGSGISEDGTTMTANVACSNCQSWNGGQMSLSSTSAGWIAAWRQGPPLDETNEAAVIQPHDAYARFQVDLTRAAISSDSNPFATNRAGGDNTGGGGGGGGGSGSGSDGGFIVSTSMDRSSILAAHGIIMALVMAVFYPLGSLAMPLVRKWWVHGVWQAIAFCLMWAGLGLGIVAARRLDMLFAERHTVFGTVIVCLFAIQPALGYLHHRHFVKTKARGIVSYVHIWWGRILMILGVVNGGLGLQASRERNSLVIAYSVVAAITFTGYLLYKGFVAFNRMNKGEDSNKEGPTPVPMPRRPYGELRRTKTYV